MMYKHIEDKSYKHLVCIIIGGSEHENHLHGLAHVGEHMCLLPYFEGDKEDKTYSTYGYTCIDHALLYFTSQDEDSLKTIRAMIENKSIVRKDRVEIAKHQVICECSSLNDEIVKKETVVKFVTENKIRNFAAGKVKDIDQITVQDVWKWLDCIIAENRIFFFFLEDLTSDVIDTQIMIRNKTKFFNNRETSIQILYLCEYIKEVCDLDIYIPLEPIFEKKDYLQLIIGENYLENYLSSFFEIVEVTEKYFSYQERYVLISAKNIQFNKIPIIVTKLRDISKQDISNSYLSNKTKLYEQLLELEKEYVADNRSILNSLIRKLVYGVPVLNIGEDIALTKVTKNRLSEELIKSLKSKIKIIVK